ncbi:hypothetical protein ACP70R_014604 [Stipagrostis hirtigluma subsp. patula]
MSPRPRPLPDLMDELLEEAFLRIPPSDPVRLVRAALVCKRWCRLITDRGFRRRYREFHRTPSMPGFLYNFERSACLVQTSSFRLPQPPVSSQLCWRTIDSRHGRILFRIDPYISDVLAVWDPITNELHELPTRPWHMNTYMIPVPWYHWNVAVLCAATGSCDHLDCHLGPFLVVFIGTNRVGMFTSVYSSEANAWSALTYVPREGSEHVYPSFDMIPDAIGGNALYFLCEESTQIVEYDLTTKQVSSKITLPPTSYKVPKTVLTTTEDGALGFARIEDSRLCLWSREADHGDNEACCNWIQSKVIELGMLLPYQNLSKTSYFVVGFADGAGVIFVVTNYPRLLFSIDLKSLQVTELGEGFFTVVFPFLSFCTPALGAAFTSEGS